jgi:membrane associated rhomboid family serine protease
LIPLSDSVALARRPLVTAALVAGSVVAYALSISAGGSILDGPTHQTIVAYGAIPYELTHLGSHCALAAAGFSQTVLCSGQRGVVGATPSQPAAWETIFSSLFVHANLLHLALDACFLAVFGATLEATLGRPRFLAFWLLGALVALALTAAVHPDSTTATIGASGAIAAVAAGYVVLHADARVQTLVVLPFHFGLPRPPAWALLALWLALEVVLAAVHAITAPGGGAGTVVVALLGGLAFGVLAAQLFARGRLAPPAAAAAGGT